MRYSRDILVYRVSFLAMLALAVAGFEAGHDFTDFRSLPAPNSPLHIAVAR